LSELRFPPSYRIEPLQKAHPRRRFSCGDAAVDDWLHTKAVQHEKKRLSVTKVLLDDREAIAGYYTLATGQIDFSDLPTEIARKLPRRALPVAVIAWLGVSSEHQGRGLGALLLARALRDCFEAGETFAFVAVILDAVSDAAKSFYERWDFAELPSHPYRLYLSAARLRTMMLGE
jgi:GNAT superfamily N-acetyltransferase